ACVMSSSYWLSWALLPAWYATPPTTAARINGRRRLMNICSRSFPSLSQVEKASCAAASRASSGWGDRTSRSSQPDDEAARPSLFAAQRQRKEQQMRTTQDYQLQGSYEAAAYEGPRGVGWVMFAAVLLGLAGIWNFLDGILAIGSSKVYAGHHSFVFSDLKTWGWIMLILGIVQCIAALTLLPGRGVPPRSGIAAAPGNA